MIRQNPRDWENQDHLLSAALFAEKTAGKGIEFNVPAAIIMVNEITRAQLANIGDTQDKHRISLLEKALHNSDVAAEEGMIQIELLNRRINPGSAFLVLAVADGWRWRADRGFHRVDP